MDSAFTAFDGKMTLGGSIPLAICGSPTSAKGTKGQLRITKALAKPKGPMFGSVRRLLNNASGKI